MIALGPFANEARHLGKSARTRAKLMDAAVSIFAREGFEAASVNSIAHAADVVNGTFYLHFKDKDDIAAAVVFRLTTEVVRQLDTAMKDIGDAVARTSCATRRFIELSAARPEWGWAMFRALLHFRELRGQMTVYLKADLQRGIAQGVFKVVLDDLLVDTFVSMTIGGALARLQGAAGPETGPKVAELQLRMLGVSPAKAKKIAWRELAPMEIKMDAPTG